jgi:hypothetical protein
MPRSPTLNAKMLLALGPERLVELLLELAEGDPAIRRQLRLAPALGAEGAARGLGGRGMGIGRNHLCP